MPTTLSPAGLARIPTDVAEIFQEVQISANNHQRNCVKLFKIHDEAHAIRTETTNGKERLKGGHIFQSAFLKCLCIALLQRGKKLDGSVKRVAQFTGAYFEFVNKKASEKYAAQVKAGGIDETDPESVEHGEAAIPGFIFTTYMLREFVLKGINAAEESVRENVLHFFSKMARSLGALAPHHYERLKNGLIEDLKRHGSDSTHHSRPSIVVCLSCLSTAAQGSDSVIERTLLTVLSPSEPKGVLKAALSDIYVTSNAIPYLVKLSRHADTSTRKLVYTALAKRMAEQDEEGWKRGPTHPRSLSIDFVERLVEAGLQDKEDAVKVAAMALVEAWVKTLEEESEPRAEPPRTIEGVFSLLRLFNVHKPNSEHRMKVVETLLEAIFEKRRGISHEYNFEEPNYWNGMGVERAVFSRVLVDFLGRTDEERLRDILPLTVNIVNDIGLHFQELVKLYDACSNDDDDMDEDDCDRRDATFVELLKVATKLDYSASASGRNQMVLMTEKILREHRLPLEVLSPGVDILLRAHPQSNRKEFVRTIARIASDLRGLASQTPEDQDNLERVEGRCLKMFMFMLQEVNKSCDFEQDKVLDYIFNIFIRPNATRARSEDLMKSAIECEGLLAVIKRDMAARIFYRSWTRLENGGADMAIEIRTILYKAIFDLLLVYGPVLFRIDEDVPLQWAQVVQSLSSQLQLADGSDPAVLSVLCHGWMKMILEDHIGDKPDLEDAIMLKLFKIWFDPTYRQLPALRHAIGEFFAGCGCMSARTQQLLQRLFVPAYREATILRVRHGKDEVAHNSSAICDRFHEWTHPEKLEASLNKTKGNAEGVNHSVHLDLACEIVMALFEKNQDDPRLKAEDKKELYKLLQRLHLPDIPNELRVGALGLLLDRLKKYRPPTDQASQMALQKFEVELTGRYRTQLSGLSESDHRKLGESKKYFDFVDDIISDDDSPNFRMHGSGGPVTRSRKRRGLATPADSQDEAANPIPKKPRTSTSSAGSRPDSEREEDVDADLSRLLSHGAHLSTATSSSSGVGNVTQDSLFSDSEGEEAEVTGILAG